MNKIIAKKENNKSGKSRVITGAVLTFLSLILATNITVVMSHRIKTVGDPHIYKKNLFAEIMLCLTFILSSLDLIFNLFTRWKNSFVKIIGWITRAVTYASAGIVLFFCGKIIIGSFIRHRMKADYALVLGMALENGKPTKDLLYRVETAKKYLDEHPDVTLILTGGTTREGEITEAEVMRKLLMKRGVPADKMILEDQSVSTTQNFINTTKLIDASSPVALITSNYHMDRAVRIAKKAGFKHVYRIPAPTEIYPYATNVLWEVLHNINEYTHIVKDTY